MAETGTRQMNISYHAVEDKDNWLIATATAVFGGMVFVFNFTLLSFIAKLAISGTKNDRFGYITHILFVSINDILGGLFMLLTGSTPVNDKTSAYACAVFVFMGLSLQLVSQGNIACICIQRYVILKHVRTLQAKWQSFHTKILLMVNLCLGVLSFGVCIITFDINRIPTRNTSCKLDNVMDEKTAKIAMLNVAFGVVITLVADVFGFLIFYQLKTQVGIAEGTDTNTGTSSSRSATDTDSSVRTSNRTRQSKALWTILIIVTFFNLSTFPSIIGSVFIVLIDDISPLFGRSLLLILYSNSLVNPIVIATRTNEVRMSIKDTVCYIFDRVRNFFTRTTR